MVVEYERDSRGRAECLPAYARRQVHVLKIRGYGADRADTVEAKVHRTLPAEFSEHLEIVNDSGGRFTMHRPEPLD